MAVSFAQYDSNPGTFSNTLDVNIPAGTRGVIVFTSGATLVTAATVGGVSATEVPDSPVIDGSSEYQCWLLGASVPTGTQTVALTGPSSGTVLIQVICVAADDDVEWIDTAVVNAAATTDPSAVLSVGGRTVFAGLNMVSGQDDVSGYTPLSGWTSRLELDIGSAGLGCYTYDTIGTSDVTAGWTQTSDYAGMLAVAVSEVLPAPTSILLFVAADMSNIQDMRG